MSVMIMKDLKLHLMISNHFIWNWKLQFMTPHCIDQIRNTAFPIGEIFCCLGARPLQIQPRHHPPNSSEEGKWINWDCFFLTCFFFQSARLTTGPEIRGCRPILVTFHNFKVGNPLLFDSPLSHLVLACQWLSIFINVCSSLRTERTCWARRDCSRGRTSTSLKTFPGIFEDFFCMQKFWFLGPRGPLVEPSIFPPVPSRPSATIFPEFIYTGIHALWIIRSLIKPTRWHKGIP